jgi:C4-dicarboxylate-specific signal transduction histidine kinase
LLQTVLQNILRYAVEAAGEDAVPRIQTSWMESSQYLDQPPNGHARSNSSKPRAGKEPAPLIVLRIEERGPQITPEVLAQLFEPMASCKRFGIAVGLGLFITKKIIESHRGQLTVTSGPNRGTIFTIALRALPLPA